MLSDVDLPFFHMSACEAGEFPFAALKWEIRRAIAGRAARIIKKHMTYGFVVSADERLFDSIIPHHPLVASSAYSFLASQMFNAVRVWADRSKYDGSIVYFFESGHKHQAEADRIMHRTAKVASVAKAFRYDGHAFQKKEKSTPLQAADLLVWHYCNDFGSQSRGGYSRDDYATLVDDREHPA